MILFKPEHIAPILAGRKTQTRRLIGKRRWKVGTVHLAKTGYRRDQTFARIRITAVRQERLGDITEEDAVREGYGSAAEYQEVFRRIYGFWEPDTPVWVIDFEVVLCEWCSEYPAEITSSKGYAICRECAEEAFYDSIC